MKSLDAGALTLQTPEDARRQFGLVAAHGPRFLCGIGISHRPLIDRVNSPGTYQQPVATMAAYLDGLDNAPTPLAHPDRVLAALGPKMLELARTRTAGTHLVPVKLHASVEFPVTVEVGAG